MGGKTYVVQTNFTAGQFAPSLYGRIDLSKYYNGLSESLNFISSPYGPLEKRHGSKFITTTKSNFGNIRLIGFEISTELSYMLEFGYLYVRFFKDGEPILNPAFPHDPYELVTPYNDSLLQKLKFVFNENTLYIVDGVNPPYKLIFGGDDVSWVLEKVVLDGPYNDEITYKQTFPTAPPYPAIEWGGDGGYGQTATISDANNQNLFASTDVGRSLQFYKGKLDDASERSDDERYFSGIITSYIGFNIVEIEWIRSPDSRSIEWAQGVAADAVFFGTFGNGWETERTNYPETQSYGWPNAIGFFEGRLIYGGASAAIQTLWASALSPPLGVSQFPVVDYFARFLSVEQQPDDLSYSYTLVSDVLTQIEWFVSSKVLVIGTAGGIWRLGQFDSTTTVTPSSVFAKYETSYGTSKIPGVNFGNTILYTQRSRRKLMSWSYLSEHGAFQGNDLTLLANNIFESPIVDMAVAVDPEERLYVIREDGKIAVLTYLEEQSVVGWSIVETDGKFISINTIPRVVDGILQTEVWVIIERENQNETFYSIETFTHSIEHTDKSFYTDSSVFYSGIPTNEIVGLDHLIGMEVQVLGDGLPLDSYTVEDLGDDKYGIILDRNVEEAIVGLPYVSRIKTLDVEPGVQVGAGGQFGLGLMRRVDEVTIRFYNTMNGFCGSSKKLYPIPFRSTYDPTYDGPPIFSGDKIINFPGNMGGDNRIIIESRSNTPMTIIAIGTMMRISDRTF